MYNAEHLDLITEVSDGFTEPLTRLSGLLETVGQQADRLDPIYVRVVVQDRQLRQLNRRLSQAQTQQLGVNLSGAGQGGGLSDTFMTGRGSHTPDEITNLLRGIRQNTDALGDITGSDGNVGGGMAMGMFGIAALQQLDNISDGINVGAQGVTSDGSGDGGVSDSFTGLSPEEMSRFGLPIQGMSERRMMRPMGLMRGESPFQIPDDALEELMSPQAFTRAFDMSGFIDAHDVFDAPSDLLGESVDSITDSIGLGKTSRTMRVFREHTDDTTLQMQQLKESFFDIRIGMTQFYDFLAAAVPIMFVFMGSLPAIIGALGGLAAAAVGAAGALAGIGALGLFGAARTQAGGDIPGMEDFMDLFDGLLEDFTAAFRPLMDRFEPMIANIIDDAIPRFFEDLAQASRVLIGLQDDFRAFGQFMSSYVTGTIETLGQFAEAARPVFTMIADGLDDLNVTEGLAGALADILPQLSHLTSLVIDALPAIRSFSEGMLMIFTSMVSTYSAIAGFLTSMAEFIPFLQDGDRALGKLVGSLFVLMSSVFLATKTADIFRAKLFKLAKEIGLTTVMTNGLSGAKGALAAKLNYVTAASTKAMMAIRGLKVALKGLLILTGVGALLVGLSTAITGLASEFDFLSSDIDGATESLREFERQRSQMGSQDTFVGDLDGAAYVDVTETQNITFEGNPEPSDIEYASFRVGSNDRSTIPGA